MVDGTLSNRELAEQQVRVALESGVAVRVSFVYCDVEIALARAVRRALEISRTLSLDVFAGSHYHCRQTMLHLLATFEPVPKFTLNVIDNSEAPTPIDHPLEVAEFLTSIQIESLEKLRQNVHRWFEQACKDYERDTGNAIPGFIKQGFLAKGEKSQRPKHPEQREGEDWGVFLNRMMAERLAAAIKRGEMPKVN